VPLDVAATGPRVIAMGARMAERLTFSVGAQPERIEWALGKARAARQAQGMGDTGISYGAQLLVICNSDTDKALETAMQVAPPLVRFQVMDGAQIGPRDEEAQRNLDAVHSGYDMNSHADMTAKDRIKGGGLSPEFIRQFAIVGNPDQVTRRLLELRAMGLDRFVIVGPRLNLPGWSEEEDSLFAREVIPALKT
jgi:5,10-methylenetetrahydromethanopterin reductase